MNRDRKTKRIRIGSAGGPMHAYDFQEPYLRAIFGFIGITDVEVVSAEGVNISPDHKQTALEAAVAQAGSLSPVLQAA